MDPAQLKAQYDQTQYLSDQHNNINRDVLKGFDTTQIEFLKSQNAQTGEIKDSAERANFAAEWRQNNGFSRINENVVSKAGDVKEAIYKGNENVTAWVNKNGADNLAATERVGGTIDTDLYRVAGQIDSSIYRSGQDLTKNIDNGHALLASQAYQTAASAQDERARYQNEMINYQRMNSDQNWNNFSKVSDKFALLAKQASDNTAAIQIEALKNKGDLAKQSAFEFSELKSSIASSEASIKDLLRAQESDRLRDALRATENKSLYFELRHRHHHRHH